jgi:hypothetical protein
MKEIQKAAAMGNSPQAAMQDRPIVSISLYKMLSSLCSSRKLDVPADAILKCSGFMVGVADMIGKYRQVAVGIVIKCSGDKKSGVADLDIQVYKKCGSPVRQIWRI